MSALTIAVLVKYVPDVQLERSFRTDQPVLDRSNSILSELDEYAVEQAVQIAEANPGSTVTALTMGPPEAESALKRALQMGADRAILLSDDALAGSDAYASALALTEALRRIDGVNLVVTGMSSTDGETALVPAQIAARLNFAPALFAAQLKYDGDALTYQRERDNDSLTLSVPLPAVLSVTDQANEPRYPNFKAIMAARKKPLETWSLAEVGLDASQVGAAGSKTEVVSVAARGERGAGQIVTDDGTAAAQLAEFLAAKKLI